MAYWEAWGYLGILLLPMLLVMIYLLKKDPELLERRMRMKEKEPEQKLIIKLSYPFYFLTYLLPGFDHRFGWSNVHLGVILLAYLIVLLGYGLFFFVLWENSYASRIIEVEKEQTVISSGPYAIVRHPMYLGIMLLYLFTPLALESYWAVILATMIFPVLVARIKNEEIVLRENLEGYQAYIQKTRYRLIPGIW